MMAGPPVKLIRPEPGWLKIARGEMGEAEVPGPESNPRIAEYLGTVGMAGDDEIAWCSAFVNWVITMDGREGTNKPNARSWMNWGRMVNLDDVLPGDVCIFSRGNSWQGHVAFYMAHDDTAVRVLGGNQSNAVCLATYLRNRLIGIRRPAEAT